MTVIANPSAAEVSYSISPSTTYRNSNTGEKTTAATSYTKVKEITLNEALACCKVSFNFQNNSAANTTVRVYLNGVSLGGTEHVYSGGYDHVVTEDFATLNASAGDLLQLYMKVAAGTGAVKDWQLGYTEYVKVIGQTLATALATTTDPTISTTNSDP